MPFFLSVPSSTSSFCSADNTFGSSKHAILLSGGWEVSLFAQDIMEAQDPPQGVRQVFWKCYIWKIHIGIFKQWFSNFGLHQNYLGSLLKTWTSKTFWIRIPRAGAWTFVNLTSSTGDSEVHQSLRSTVSSREWELLRWRREGSHIGRGGSSNRSLKNQEETEEQFSSPSLSSSNKVVI